MKLHDAASADGVMLRLVVTTPLVLEVNVAPTGPKRAIPTAIAQQGRQLRRQVQHRHLLHRRHLHQRRVQHLHHRQDLFADFGSITGVVTPQIQLHRQVGSSAFLDS